LVRLIKEIPVRSLDSFAEQQGVKHIDVLKMDVEGWENECLKGCQTLLSSNKVSVIQLELTTTKIREHTVTIDEIKELLAGYDFDYFIVKHRQIPSNTRLCLSRRWPCAAWSALWSRLRDLGYGVQDFRCAVPHVDT
jgi:hypothetical protein